MDARYRIAPARASDVPALAAIELAASALLVGHAPPAVLTEVTPVDELLAAQAAGRLLVALADEAPVGFAQIAMAAPDLPHLEELGVHPDHGRRGVGAALVRAVCRWAAGAGYAEVTLTTFRAVPFNMPFYARLGFAEVPDGALRPELQAIVRREAARGLDPARRVVMRWPARPR